MKSRFKRVQYEGGGMYVHLGPILGGFSQSFLSMFIEATDGPLKSFECLFDLYAPNCTIFFSSKWKLRNNDFYFLHLVYHTRHCTMESKTW